MVEVRECGVQRGVEVKGGRDLDVLPVVWETMQVLMFWGQGDYAGSSRNWEGVG